MTEQPTSPLAEAAVESLDELFSRDPHDYSNEDLAKIVHELRSRRALWAKEEADATKDQRRVNSRKVPKADKTPEEVAAALASLDLKIDI